MRELALVDSARDKKYPICLKNCNCTERGGNKARKVDTVTPPRALEDQLSDLQNVQGACCRKL